MTVEQIELRKILTQMLADNGIDRSTLPGIVKEALEEKITKRREVVVDHLYLLTPRQVEHIIYLQRHWQTSYKDDEMNRIFDEMRKGK